MFQYRLQGVCCVFLLGGLFGLPVSAQTGNIAYCTLTSYYGQEPSRTAEVWQFTSDALTVAYTVERIQDVNVCGLTLIDKERDVVFTREGDNRSYQRLSEADVRYPCAEALQGNMARGETPDGSARVAYAVTEVAEARPVTVTYPVNALLAPAYIGIFPVLADVPLEPYDGRGFAANMPVEAVAATTNISVQSSISAEALDQILAYLLQELTGWELTPVEQTDYGQNPYTVIGNRDVYLSLTNPETEAIIRVEFHLNTNDGVLQMLVTVPPSARQAASVFEAIQGSSASLSSLETLFDGWEGVARGPAATYQDGRIESYVLRDADRTWLLDIERDGEQFDVLYSRVITGAPCEPMTFLPDWATHEGE